MNEGLPQRDPISQEIILGLYMLFSVGDYNDILYHTFPFTFLFGARISGAGMGGRIIAASIPLPVVGV